MFSLDEIVVDNFAGGGGASTAIDQALGRDPEEAINHDPIAIAMHKANHPRTRHWCQNVWQVSPYEVADGRPVGLSWFSPDCTDHSKAKGGKPRETGRRDLAWVVVAWAKTVRPRIIMLENVEEFADWGPLVDGRRCPDRKGETFKRWVLEIRRHGYAVDWRELRACDFGAPTTRKRLFLVARRDGAPIKWPEPTHARLGADGLLPWRSAAEIIDWNLACHSIFLSREEGRALGVKRPLADKTMARIAAGVKRYVLDAAEPFIVNLTHHGAERNESLGEPVRTLTCAHRGEKAIVVPHVTKFCTGSVGVAATDPLPTITANSFIKRPGGAPSMGVVAATLVQSGYGEREGQRPRSLDIESPLGTVVAGGSKHALVAAFMAQHNESRGVGNPGHTAIDPVSTIACTGSHQSVVAAHLLNLKGADRRDRAASEPAFTVTSGGYHIAEVRAFLIKYHGMGTQWQAAGSPLLTADTHARFGLVQVSGALWQLADIGMRMLAPRELFNAQGFRASYKIDPIYLGKPLTKTAQIHLCGNSVSPPPAVALLKANIHEAPKMRNLARTPIEERCAA